MFDLLGYRALVGAVVPDYNTVVLPDFYRLNLTGVTAHASDFTSGTGDLARAVAGAIDRLAARTPIRAALALDEDLTGARPILREDFASPAGVDIITPADALVAAVRCFGTEARVAVVSPFDAAAHAAAVARLHDRGVRIVSDVAADAGGPRAAAATSYVRMRALYDAAVARGAPDVVVQIGHNLPMARLVGNLEEDHGRPVLAINTALIWKLLRDASIFDPVPGFGALLFHH